MAQFDNDAGVASVYHGSGSGLSIVPTTQLQGYSVGDRFGISIALNGDVDGDGYADLLVGAPRNDDESGRVYLYRGSPEGVMTFPTSTLAGDPGAQLGISVGMAGDVDADGHGDVLIREYEGSNYVFLYQGSAGGLLSAPATTLSSGAFLEVTVKGAGDLDGDGLADAMYLVRGTSSSYYHEAGWFRGYYEPYPDTDGDGLEANQDCDDDNASVGAPTRRTLDADGDGHGSMDATLLFCPGAPGSSDDTTDCDDRDPDVSGTVTQYLDRDGDGYGGLEEALVCPGAAGYYTTPDDCDDANASVHPSAPETCDGVDDDCDALVDDDATLGTVVAFIDVDGDGYGSASAEICAGTAGYSDIPGECDDADPYSYPGAPDPAGDGIDQDCDGAEELGQGAQERECGCGTPPRDGRMGLGLGLLLALTVGRRCGGPRGLTASATPPR